MVILVPCVTGQTTGLTPAEIAHANVIGAVRQGVTTRALPSSLFPTVHNDQWVGVAFAPPPFNKLLAAPFNRRAVLVLSLATTPPTATKVQINEPSVQNFSERWAGIAYAPNTNLCYCAPFNQPAVLIINPRNSVSYDITTLTGVCNPLEAPPGPCLRLAARNTPAPWPQEN